MKMFSFKYPPAQMYFRKRFLYLKTTAETIRKLKRKFKIKHNCYTFISRRDENICRGPMIIHRNLLETNNFEKVKRELLERCEKHDNKIKCKFTFLDKADSEFSFLRKNPEFNQRTLLAAARSKNMSLQDFMECYTHIKELYNREKNKVSHAGRTRTPMKNGTGKKKISRNVRGAAKRPLSDHTHSSSDASEEVLHTPPAGKRKKIKLSSELSKSMEDIYFVEEKVGTTEIAAHCVSSEKMPPSLLLYKNSENEFCKETENSTDAHLEVVAGIQEDLHAPIENYQLDFKKTPIPTSIKDSGGIEEESHAEFAVVPEEPHVGLAVAPGKSHVYPDELTVIVEEPHAHTEFSVASEESYIHSAEFAILPEEPHSEYTVAPGKPHVYPTELTVIAESHVHPVEELAVSPEEPCLHTSELTVIAESLVHPVEELAVSPEEPCLHTSELTVIAESLVHPVEELTVIAESHVHPVEELAVSPEEPCLHTSELTVIAESHVYPVEELSVSPEEPCLHTPELTVIPEEPHDNPEESGIIPEAFHVHTHAEKCENIPDDRFSFPLSGDYEEISCDTPHREGDFDLLLPEECEGIPPDMCGEGGYFSLSLPHTEDPNVHQVDISNVCVRDFDLSLPEEHTYDVCDIYAPSLFCSVEHKSPVRSESINESLSVPDVLANESIIESDVTVHPPFDDDDDENIVFHPSGKRIHLFSVYRDSVDVVVFNENEWDVEDGVSYSKYPAKQNNSINNNVIRSDHYLMSHQIAQPHTYDHAYSPTNSVLNYNAASFYDMVQPGEILEDKPDFEKLSDL